MQLKVLHNEPAPAGRDRQGFAREVIVPELFVVESERKDTNSPPAKAHFSWDGARNRWWTIDEKKARTLASYAQNGLAARLSAPTTTVAAYVRSYATSSVVGTSQQETFWYAITDGKGHIVLEARAGCGKSFSIIEAGKRALEKWNKPDKPLRVCYLAFNKSAAEDLKPKAPSQAQVMTLHALGNAALAPYVGSSEPVKSKVRTLLTELLVPEEVIKGKPVRELGKPIEKLVSLCKGHLYEGTPDQLDELAQRHNIELEPNKARFNSRPGRSRGSKMTADEMEADKAVKARIYELVPRVLERCMEVLRTIDFDDMIWLPVVLGLPVERFHLLFVDEAQDMNLCQQHLAFMSCHEKGRIVIVGDPFQSIYGFRGADARSMPRMTELLAQTERGVQTLPLTFTRRCPKSHVARVHAEGLVPDLEAMPEAIEGEIADIELKHLAETAQPNDMILCRCNAPLLSARNRLLRAGKKAVYKGKDLSGVMRDLIEGLKAPDVKQLVLKLQSYRLHESERLEAAGKSAQVIASHEDNCDTLEVLCEGVRTIPELYAKIKSIFDTQDPDGAVVLTSVHGAKGLEADTIFILNPDLLPHPAAVKKGKKEDIEQEMNIKCVALTRSKRRMVFVHENGKLPVVGATGAPPAPPVEVEPEVETGMCECGVRLSDLHDFFGPELEGHRDELKECPKCGVTGAMHINEGGNTCAHCGAWSDLWPNDPDPGALAEAANEVFYPAENGLSPDDYDEEGEAIMLADLEDTITITVPSGADWRARLRALLRAAVDLPPYDQADITDKIQEALSCL